MRLLWITMLFSTSAQASDVCNFVLRNLLKNFEVSETRLLADFDPHAPFEVKRTLGERSEVFQVATSKGAYILRFEAKSQSMSREAFAVAFTRESPLKSFPAVRLLDSESTQAIQKQLRLQVKDLNRAVDVSPRASVSVFYGAQTGDQYLDSLLYQGKFDLQIFSAAEEIAEGTDDFDGLVEYLVDGWKQATPGEQQALTRDLKQLLPKAKIADAPSAIAEFKRQATPGLISRLELLRLQRVPAAVRRQLADGWLLYHSLGIPDFHSKNWLIHQGTVMPIDLGYPQVQRVELLPSETWNPYRKEKITPEVMNLLFQESSPEMVEYLRSLRATDLTRLARASHYDLSAAESKLILDRIQHLLSRVPSKR